MNWQVGCETKGGNAIVTRDRIRFPFVLAQAPRLAREDSFLCDAVHSTRLIKTLKIPEVLPGSNDLWFNGFHLSSPSEPLNTMFAENRPNGFTDFPAIAIGIAASSSLRGLPTDRSRRSVFRTMRAAS